MDLHKALSDLRQHISFKSNTRPGDIILVGMPAGLFFGVVQSIDSNVKKNWFNLNFKLLILPPADITWILRIPQMNGELFTINNEDHFVIAVDTTRDNKQSAEQDSSFGTAAGTKLTLIKNETDFE
ncbi:hypothetical protein ACFL43_04310 [Thermodesulfobacteriota bacterium]